MRTAKPLTGIAPEWQRRSIPDPVNNFACRTGGRYTANISQTNAEPATGGISSKTILILALVGGAAAAGAAVALGKGKASTSTTPPPSGAVISPGTPGYWSTQIAGAPIAGSDHAYAVRPPPGPRSGQSASVTCTPTTLP